MKKLKKRISEIQSIIKDIENMMSMLVDSRAGVDAYENLIKLRKELSVLEEKTNQVR